MALLLVSLIGIYGASATASEVTAAATSECHGHEATIVGKKGDDKRLGGTRHADVIDARAGDDLILARGGNDIICAGSGKDFVKAGRGQDKAFGESGGDILLGQDGADDLRGGSGGDRLGGGDGKDLCVGGRGKDFAERKTCEHIRGAKPV